MFLLFAVCTVLQRQKYSTDLACTRRDSGDCVKIDDSEVTHVNHKTYAVSVDIDDVALTLWKGNFKVM